jgi:protein-S-isoprenylcysteine O-methyltransferase Ste14
VDLFQGFPMALNHELERVGNWFFRWRSYLPLLLLVLFLLALKDFSYLTQQKHINRLWELFCLAISTLGLAIRIITVGYVPRGTSGRNTRKQVAEVLNTTGMYSVVRHPLYVGNFIMWLGISLFFHLWWFTLLIALIFWVYYEKIMYAEEAFLQEKFGSQFILWAEKTPLFIPHFSLWQAPEMEFSLKSALKREYASFFAMIAIFTGLKVFSSLWVDKTFILDPMWTFIFLTSLAFYLAVRFLKKKTQILDDDR